MDLVAYLTTLDGSVVAVAVLAVLTAILCEVCSRKMTSYFENAKWWPIALEPQKAMMKNFGYADEDCTPEGSVGFYTFIVLICVHDLLCSIFALPVVCLGWAESGNVGQMLFLLAAFGTVSFDIYDCVKKFILCFFPSKFKWLGPPCPLKFFIVACCLHHVLAISMVVPLTLKYPTMRPFHIILLSLLFAAGVCCTLGQYKFSLNVEKRGEMIQYKCIAILQLIVMWITRAILWFPQLYQALMCFKDQDDTTFLYGGCFAGLTMTLFNVVMLVDVTEAAVKWLPKPLPKEYVAEYESVEDKSIIDQRC
eukprot:TRINITY_DN62231_c0_g1_i1.p1 TRINITY_DN62231_c0_g1~~TRINITY_DN62231_c0_g1_i1.p1  ORF type:complete len:341 (+),score=40.91 TRINITY_DN62231_c0_g1_i1:100-1023(+)